jgi:hypothetical protein
MDLKGIFEPQSQKDHAHYNTSPTYTHTHVRIHTKNNHNQHVFHLMQKYRITIMHNQQKAMSPNVMQNKM